MTAPYGAVPVHSDRLGDTALVVIQAVWDGRDSYQLYASDGRSWALVGIHDAYQGALVDCQCWVRELQAGATLAVWTAKHPDGCNGHHLKLWESPNSTRARSAASAASFTSPLTTGSARSGSLARIDAIANERADDLLVNALLRLRFGNNPNERSAPWQPSHRRVKHGRAVVTSDRRRSVQRREF